MIVFNYQYLRDLGAFLLYLATDNTSINSFDVSKEDYVNQKKTI